LAVVLRGQLLTFAHFLTLPDQTNQPHKKPDVGASGGANHSRQAVVSMLIVALGLAFDKLFGGDPHGYQK
jgi:hypothetical protein